MLPLLNFCIKEQFSTHYLTKDATELLLEGTFYTNSYSFTMLHLLLFKTIHIHTKTFKDILC